MNVSLSSLCRSPDMVFPRSGIEPCRSFLRLQVSSVPLEKLVPVPPDLLFREKPREDPTRETIGPIAFLKCGKSIGMLVVTTAVNVSRTAHEPASMAPLTGSWMRLLIPTIVKEGRWRNIPTQEEQHEGWRP